MEFHKFMFVFLFYFKLISYDLTLIKYFIKYFIKYLINTTKAVS